MRSRSTLANVLLGSGLVVAVTTTLILAAALAGMGLLFELGDARVTVITEQPATLIASHGADGAGEGEAEATEDDPTADPHHEAASGAHTDPARAPDGTVELVVASATVRANALLAATTPTAEPFVVEASPAPEPTLAPSPEPVVATAPAPPPTAARATRAAQPTGPPRSTADVPIVMYHHVGPLPPNPDVYRRDLTVSPDLFERTLTLLADQEVSTVTMADLFEHFRGGAALPKRAVILTFDDGYDDNYDHAFRLLQEHGMVGTFFITTDFVGRPGYLTWAQIGEMAEAGMEIGAHSTNHADFAAISPNELRRQLVEPKAVLEEHIRQPIRFLAYPAGKYNARVMAASQAAGYEAAVTVIHGLRHVPAQAFELRRVRARGADTAAGIVTRMTPPPWR